MKKLENILKNPPKEYRAVPFWSWNDKLDPEFLRWQIREMDKAGLGGFFMHARGGLQTKYLSDEWMECIGACIYEGRKTGMNAWCYDEEGWPSGFAGGAVTAMGDRYHVRWLELEYCRKDNILADSSVLGVYAVHENSGSIRIGRLINAGQVTDEQKIVVVRHRSNPYYIDILNAEVVKAFIQCTHEKYYSKFGDEFGRAMPGFFTDEPQYARGGIPWSYIIPEEFQRKYGYDLLEKLPLLYIEGEGYENVRYDFWALVSQLFVTSFAEQIYSWCIKHNCKFTGHAMAEDGLFSQMQFTAGCMPMYEYMHIPGIDWLGRRISSPVTPKQVGSVASQLGKKFVLSETFALCGWDVNFEELKWIAEWQYVNGINLMCQHLEGYTLRGLRKRDYPPSLFYQQSWWEEYRLFNDYFARLGVLLTSGESGVDVLLLHPIKSAWIAYNGNNNDILGMYDRVFLKTTQMLSDMHIDHHYGDETIISRHGRVEGNKFIVGQCAYKVVVVPSMHTLDGATIKLLGEFIDNGGYVVGTGSLPILSEGRRSEALEKLNGRIKCFIDDPQGLYGFMKAAGAADISIAADGNEIGAIHYQKRVLEEASVYYLVNHDKEKAYTADITLQGKYSLKRYAPESNEAHELPCQYANGTTKVTMEFVPMQSCVLIAEVAKDSCTGSETADMEDRPYIELKAAGDWQIDSMDMNSLTLDYCRYSIDGREWSEPTPVIKLMDILLNLRRNCGIALKFNFEVDMNLEQNKEMFLVLEKAGEFEIQVNGSRISYRDEGWWKDSAFKKVNIKEHVRNGSNEILLKREFYQSPKVYDILFGENVLETEKNKLTYDVELESIYIIGDFGVFSKSGYTEGDRKALFTDGPFVITDRPSQVKSGVLTQQGFSFFAGALSLSQDINVKKENGQRYVFCIKQPYAQLVKIFVNDRLAKVIPWGPYTADITDFLTDGWNKISIKFFASNRNLLGPHHHIAGETYSVGPSSFTDTPGWTDIGYEGSIWRDSYCFVKFGFEL